MARPNLGPKNRHYDDFCVVHEALGSKRISGFICETVGTLEAIKLAGRSAYFNSIRPNVDVKPTFMKENQVVLSVNIGTNHSQHPGLVPILQDGLEAAFALGICVMRAARIGLPVPPVFLSLEHYADEHDIVAAAIRDNYWGEVLGAIEARGAGEAVLKALERAPGQAPRRVILCLATEGWTKQMQVDRRRSVAAHVSCLRAQCVAQKIKKNAEWKVHSG